MTPPHTPSPTAPDDDRHAEPERDDRPFDADPDGNGPTQADALIRALSPVVHGLAATLGSNFEVVLHDFRRPESSIVDISGSVTSRHVGGAMSEIGLELLAQGDEAQDKLNYVTRTADGKTIKSSTMVLRDGSGRCVGALCINVDITQLRLAMSAMTALVGETEPTSSPLTVFSDNIDDVIDTVLGQEEVRLGRALRHDTRAGRLQKIKALDDRGVLNLPKAASRIAKRLNVSRATVYADLNTVRSFDGDGGNHKPNSED